MSVSLAGALRQLHQSSVRVAPDERRLVASSRGPSREMTTASSFPAEDGARTAQEHTPSGDAHAFGGPILDGERLRLHAAEVAATQPARVRRLTAGPLHGQFEDV